MRDVLHERIYYAVKFECQRVGTGQCFSKQKLNKNFAVDDFEKIEIKTYENEIKNNDFLIQKSEKIVISGEVFDSQPLLKTLYKKNDKKTFSKNFASEIKINFDRVLTGAGDDDVFNIGAYLFN